MTKEIEICDGATISAAEIARVEQAMEQLEKDKGAVHQLSVIVRLHVVHEFPKTLYKGKEVRVVQNAADQKAATEAGFGAYDHKALTAPDEPAPKKSAKVKEA